MSDATRRSFLRGLARRAQATRDPVRPDGRRTSVGPEPPHVPAGDRGRRRRRGRRHDRAEARRRRPARRLQHDAAGPGRQAVLAAALGDGDGLRPRRGARRGDVLSGTRETTYRDPALVQAPDRRGSLRRPALLTRRTNVVASRSTRDQQGPGRRQRRRLRVRQPRQAGHGHDHHQLRPAAGAARRAELLRVRRRRPLLDPHRQQRRRAARHHLPVPLRDDAAQPEHVPLQHGPDLARSTTRTGTSASSTRVTRVEGRKSQRARRRASPARPATSVRARRRTTRRSASRPCTRSAAA